MKSRVLITLFVTMIVWAFSNFFSVMAFANDKIMVEGRSFSILATQQIEFVPTNNIPDSAYISSAIPLKKSLRDYQSSVKSQGKRGACTYFVVTSLVESLIKKNMKQEIDISEEYLAWASKVKTKLRANEEDSSVAVGAATIQEHGFLRETDMPYQGSWFDEGAPCFGEKKNSKAKAICYSHNGPNSEQEKLIIDAKNFVFESVDSSSLDVVKSIASNDASVTASITLHPETLVHAAKNGNLILSPKQKSECQGKIAKCSGHAVLIVGYDLKNKLFQFKNSWGEKWGDKGYGTIPFEYMDQMSPRKFLTGRMIGNVTLPTQQAN